MIDSRQLLIMFFILCGEQIFASSLQPLHQGLKKIKSDEKINDPDIADDIVSMAQELSMKQSPENASHLTIQTDFSDSDSPVKESESYEHQVPIFQRYHEYHDLGKNLPLDTMVWARKTELPNYSPQQKKISISSMINYRQSLKLESIEEENL